MFLTAIRRRCDVDDSVFPWTLPVLRELEYLTFTAPVTFLVGENGSGKSTLLEAIAVGMNAIAVGSHEVGRDETLAVARRVANGLRFVRRRHPRTRLFMRAEDVFGFVNRVTAGIRGLEEIEDEIGGSTEDRSFGQRISAAAVAGQRKAMIARYGENPDAQSHGETFLSLLMQRIVPQGLYLLDEPEAPFSPKRQLALIDIINRGVEEGSQFVIATHSPVLMALEGAEILVLDDGKIRSVDYDDVEHVSFTRMFLNNPHRFLRRL